MSLSRKKIIIISASVLFAVGFFAIAENIGLVNLFHSPPPPAKDQAFNNTKKETTLDGTTENSSTAPGSSAKDVETSTTGQYTSPEDPANIQISARQENGSVTISSKLIGYSDGDCSLMVTNGPQSVTRSAAVLYASQFSTCAGFTIPVSDVGAGSWSIKLSVTSGGQTIDKLTSLEVK